MIPLFVFRQEVDTTQGGQIEFKQMEVTDIVSVVALRNKIFTQHGQIEILINNAALYFYPSLDPTEHYCQVEEFSHWSRSIQTLGSDWCNLSMLDAKVYAITDNNKPQ